MMRSSNSALLLALAELSPSLRHAVDAAKSPARPIPLLPTPPPRDTRALVRLDNAALLSALADLSPSLQHAVDAARSPVPAMPSPTRRSMPASLIPSDRYFRSAFSVMASASAQLTPSVKPKDNVPRGILFMILATLLFTVSNALAKWLVAIYPVGEIMFFRSFSSLLICAAVILPVTGLAVFATRKPGAHIARGASQSISQTFTVLAVSMMPLAGATAISFSAPLWGALLSVLWLKERAGPARWSVLLTGFFGVLIVTNPGADSLQMGALFALANAVMYGSVTVAVRGMSATESANTLLMWQMVTIAIFHTFLLAFGFSWPTPFDAAMLIFSGVANSMGQYFWTLALRLAPATAVAPFYYLMLVWALAIGFLVWGDVPTVALLIGSGIVVVSGMFLLWHESRSR